MSLGALRPARQTEAPELAETGPEAEKPALPQITADQPQGKAKWRPRRLLDLCFLGSLAGVAILALAGLGTALLGPSALADSDRLYALGQIVDFRDTGDGARYLRQGWARPTAAGTRTQGSVADLVFPARLSTKYGLLLHLNGAAIFADDEDKFWIDLLVNGTWAMRYEVQRGQGTEPVVAVLPYLPDNHDAPLHVTLVVGADHTKLDRSGASGFQVQTLTLN